MNAGSESGGAGIGSGDQDGQNKPEDAHHIEISGGTVEAWSNYAGAGIGGGRDGSGYDISITGGVVRAQGYFGAGIGEMCIRDRRCADPVQPDLLRVGRAGLSASNDCLRRGQLVLDVYKRQVFV